MRSLASLTLLLALLGGSQGLQAGLEYHYRYQAKVLTQVNGHTAATGIKADLTLQVTHEGTTIFKLGSVESFQHEGLCDPSTVPLRWTPLTTNIQHPFTVFFNQSQTSYLESPEEAAWITNLRKAVANIFNIPPLQGHHTDGPGFLVTEDTMAGTCNSWYMLLKVPEYQASVEHQRQEATIEEDVQSETPATSGSYTAKTSGGRKTSRGRKTSGRKTSGQRTSPVVQAGPQLKKDLWTLTRSVDFETCKGGFSMRINGLDSAESIEQSSGGRYLLRGDAAGGWRLERATVEGVVTVFTHHDDYTKHISTFTNQTLELVTVRLIESELPISYPVHRHYSFHYQPDHLPDHHQEGEERGPSLEEALTGVPMTEQQLIDTQAQIVQSVQAIAGAYAEGASGDLPLAYHFTKAVDLMRHLTQHQITAVVSKFPRDNFELHGAMRYIAFLAAVSTGTEPAIKFILEQMDQPRFPPGVTPRLFIDGLTTLKNPALVPRIIDAALAIPWGGRGESHKIIALLNTAKLVNKLCVKCMRKETTSYTCDTQHTCDPDTVLSSLVPTLTQAIQDREAPEWQRLVNLEALCSLGSPSIIPVVKNIILGLGHPTRFMRMNAMFCLSSLNMPTTAYLSIVNILTPVLENVGEVPVVRSVAFLTLATWAPSQQWWTRMALSTWHEPSSQVASFISSTITSLAHVSHKVSEYAGRAAHLVKPSPPASATHSTYVYLQEFLHYCQTGADVRYAWLSSSQDVFPTAVTFRLQTDGFFGTHEDLVGVTYQEGLQGVLKQLRRYTEKGASENIQLVLDMFQQLKEELEVQPKEVTDHLLWHMLDHRILLKSTLNVDTILEELNNLPYTPLFHELTNKVLSFRAQDSVFVLPTDLGLPLVIKYVGDTVRLYTVVLDGSTDRPVGDSPRSNPATINLHLSRNLNFEMKTLVPWNSGSVVSAGLINEQSFSLRLKAWAAKSPRQRARMLALQPINQDRMKIVELHNYPYTSVKPLYLADTDPAAPSATPAWDNNNRINEDGQVLPAAAGISLHYSWQGDFSLPRGFLSFLREVKMSQPSYKNWHYIITLDPQQSSTKELLFTIPDMRESRPERIVQDPEVEELGQVSQGLQEEDSYEYLGQVSQTQSGSIDFEEFGPVEGEQESGRYTDMQQLVSLGDGGKVSTVGASVQLMADTPGRKYEAMLTWTGSADNTHTRLLLSLSDLPPPAVLSQDPNVFCLDLSIVRPSFPPRSVDLEPEQFHKSFSLKVEQGTSCSSHTPVMQIQAYLDTSQESLDHVMDQVTTDCQPGHEPPTPYDVYMLPIYDHINLHATWTQTCPPLLLNMTQHVDDHLRTWLDPIITYDHTVTNPPRRVVIRATKKVETDEWRVRTEQPNGVSLVEHLHVPAIITKAVAVPAPLSKALLYNFFMSYDQMACSLDANQVRTVDGHRYTFEPSSCWTTAVLDYGSQDPSQVAPTDVSVQVRYTDQWEVQVVYPWSGRLLDITRSHVMLNGEQIHESGDDLEIFRGEDLMLVRPTSTMAVQVSDNITIWLSKVHYNEVTGLCGNFDGVADNDLQGPQGCLYTDPQLFSQAWATAGQGCNRFTLNRQKQKVTEYQQACPKHYYQPTGVTQPNTTVTCTDWEYEDKTIPGYQCQALVQTPTCKPGCVPAFTINKLVKYGCSPVVPDVEDNQCHIRLIPTTIPASCITSVQPAPRVPRK